MHRAHLALGSNVGDRGDAIRDAVDQLASLEATRILGRSRLLVTKAVGGPAGQPDFLNAAVLVDTGLEPHALLDAVHGIEQTHGRPRDRQGEERWGPRTLDIDIVFFADVVLCDSRLTLPHPRAAQREFVLRPIADLAPEYLHPVEGRTVAELLDDLAHVDVRGGESA